MTATTLKKAALRLHPAEWRQGFVDRSQLRSSGPLEYLLPEGQKATLDRATVQAVYFVADFAAAADLAAPPRRGATPLPGLRVRVRTHHGFLLEGILATELLALGEGAELTPLYSDSPWQLLFVPPTALRQVLPLALVRPPRRRRGPQADLQQFPLFQAGTDTPAREVG